MISSTRIKHLRERNGLKFLTKRAVRQLHVQQMRFFLIRLFHFDFLTLNDTIRLCGITSLSDVINFNVVDGLLLFVASKSRCRPLLLPGVVLADVASHRCVVVGPLLCQFVTDLNETRKREICTESHLMWSLFKCPVNISKLKLPIGKKVWPIKLLLL